MGGWQVALELSLAGDSFWTHRRRSTPNSTAQRLPFAAGREARRRERGAVEGNVKSMVSQIVRQTVSTGSSSAYALAQSAVARKGPAI
jgi:hypothetical protein